MAVRSALVRRTAAMLLIATTIQLSGCGTLLYPERRGQSSGQIDPAVAILNGVGVIVFIIPGLIAFAIDFATGAIYLPGAKKSKATTLSEELRIINVSATRLSAQDVDAIVERETGIVQILSRQDLTTQALPDLAAIDGNLRY